MMRLKPNETILKGSWKTINSTLENDEVSSRIEFLTNDYIKKIACDETGWETLFQDPHDMRYWELTYPNSESHGGGAPQLKWLTEKEAKAKYHLS